MSLEEQIKEKQNQLWKIQRDQASIRWKERNPEKVKKIQDEYRKTHSKELALKAREKRKKFREEINARRRENYRRKKNV